MSTIGNQLKNKNDGIGFHTAGNVVLSVAQGGGNVILGIGRFAGRTIKNFTLITAESIAEEATKGFHFFAIGSGLLTALFAVTAGALSLDERTKPEDKLGVLFATGLFGVLTVLFSVGTVASDKIKRKAKHALNVSSLPPAPVHPANVVKTPSGPNFAPSVLKA